MNAFKVFQARIRGFSLIELMVVIAIIALLAAVAVPSYKSYVGKSRMGEVLGFITQQQKTWAESMALGSVPSNPTSPSAYITSITNSSTGFAVVMAANDTISPNFSTAVTVTYTASTDSAQSTSGALAWTCVVTGGANLTARQAIVSQFFTNCTTS